MKKTILVADDDRDTVQMIQDLLEHAGYATVAAYEGVRAIELAHKHKPDLILLDIKMPSGSGKTVLHSLKSHVDTEKIPVVVITALSDLYLEKEVMDGGAADFIKKPYDNKILLEKVKLAMGGEKEDLRC